MHSEMFTTGLMRLHQAGKVTNAAKGVFEGVSVTTFALGTSDLYRWLDDNPAVAFLPVDVVNDPTVIGGNHQLVSINGALCLDLYGQVVADNIDGKQISGVGGHEDFVAGADLHVDSHSLICLSSTVTVGGERRSRILPLLPEGTIVSTPRHHTGVVVTEYGAAELTGLTVRERARPWPPSRIPTSVPSCTPWPRVWDGTKTLSPTTGDEGGVRIASLTSMAVGWSALPYEDWRRTCDTLHAHTQVLGKLAAALAPPEPQLQHAALRLTARGWETLPLPAPDGSGALVVALDLQNHEAVAEHSDGRVRRVPLAPDRAVGEVTREVLAVVGDLVGSVRINLSPQETPWTTPLDEDDEHATYDAAQVATYFGAATQAALMLAAIRAPYRGRSTPVNAWWGSFDLAVSLFSGRPVEPPSDGFIVRNSANAQQIEVGWWPGDARYPRAAFFAYAFPGRGRP